MRLIVAGGGTAGHTTPILAVLDALEEFDQTPSVLFIGSGGELEKRILKGRGVSYVSIPAGKYRRYNRGVIKAALDLKTNAQNTRDFFKTNIAFVRAFSILRKFKPDVVFIKGGFVGLPVGLAARRLKIPIVLHDSDAVLGLTNKLLAKYAVTVATGFPAEMYDHYKLNNITYVGNPLRHEAITGSKEAAKVFFGFKEQKPNIFIFGGSKGARAINDAVRENISILTKQYNIVHLTGKQGIEEARFERSRLTRDQQKSYAVYDLLESHIGLAYAIADVVVSRSGANTIAELAHWAKPALLIPYESAANNEQHANAEVLTKAGAARILVESELKGLRLVSEIDKLIDNRSERSYLAKKIASFARDDAATSMAAILYKVASKQMGEKRGQT